MNQSDQFLKSMAILQNEFIYVIWDQSNHFEVFDCDTGDQLYEFETTTIPIDAETAIEEIEFLL